MNSLITTSGVRGFTDEHGIAQLNLEDVARGLGFTQTKNGVEYIRWETVSGYLGDVGFSQQAGKEGYIPENIFYRLAMKAKNQTAEAFQAKVADEILPAIRKTGSYFAPQMSQIQIIAAIAQAAAEQEAQLKQLTVRQVQQAEQIQSIREITALNPNDWRKDTAALLNKMALKLGGYEHLSNIRGESYKLLNERFNVCLETRLTNKRRRMAEEGICKSKRDKLNVLDVIAEDKKLIEGYVMMIKELAIRYGI